MDYPRHIGFLCAASLFGVVYGGAPSLATAQIRISGLTDMKVVEVREERGQLILRSDDGRLFSVPLDRVDGLAGISVEEINRGLEADSADVTVAEILDLLGAGISEATITAYVQRKGAHFNLSAADLLALKRAGATEPFLQFLIRAGGRRRFLPGYSGPRRQARQETTTSTTHRFSAPSYTDAVPEGIPYYPYVYPGYTSYVGYAPYFASHTVRATKARSSRSRSKVRHHRRASGNVAQRPGTSLHHRGQSARRQIHRSPAPSRPRSRGAMRSSSPRLSRPSTARPRGIGAFSPQGRVVGRRR